MNLSRRFDVSPGVAGLAAFLAGGLLPLAFAPFDILPLAVLSPAVLFWLWHDAAPRRAAGLGFLFGLGQFGIGVSWVFVAINEFGGTGMLPAALLTGLFVAALALYPALVGYLGRRLAPRSGPATALLLLWPALWTGGEWLRGWLFSGFPWLSLGYSQIDGPLAGWGPVAGVYGMSWVVAFTAGLVAWLVSVPGLQVKGARVVVPILLAAVFWGGAWWVDRLEWTSPEGKPLTVSLIQGNLPQETKWEPGAIRERLETYAGLTRERLGQSDLVVWPENAVTVFYHEIADQYFDPLEREAVETGTDLILGLPVLAEDGRQYFTSMMSLGSHRDFYFKQHLVPFGEYVPFESLLRGLIGFFDVPMSSFIPGPEGQQPLQVAGHRAAVSVCYEDAFGSQFARTLQNATLLVNGSNNAWYGDSLAPHQHLQISRMRALETGRPMLRATTNGISALVDARGRLLATSPQFERYVLTHRVQPMTGTTPYGLWRNLPVLIWLLAGTGIALVLSRKFAHG
ncbi:apolipoprotein N-acyltransferase [Thiohalomonas denitrificans]|uniref:Apolipoprotein N-acyltransferase n=1 Tax=Thiohalomonas denitrificans TaxID=415747 RepID=A0A1G5PRR2_9GAMM|nr:apolipoprotein N-acyltransferase [Thiohalomonas denitrificans]SCZ51729.1 apolipoprotein N-acyltransferase [Thiohalomonas denitrificans]